jgi:glutathione reductase (NADPH)
VRQTFDLIVIGTGTAASTVAFHCQSAGWKVAIVDSRPFGGTCALRGCDPKKVLVGAAELADWLSRMKGHGVCASDARIDWAELMRFKRSFTEPVPKNREQSFAKAGITAFNGRARFVNRTTVKVGDDVLDGRYVVIATGAMPRNLGIPGEQYITTSNQFLDLGDIPRRILFIGGGYISFEFAHIAARAGAQVTILHRGAQPLQRFDPDLVVQLIEKTKRLGANVKVNIQVESIEKSTDKITIHASAANGGKETYEADLVVHGAGRVPEISDLDLSAAGVEKEEHGIRVNEFLQSTSNPGVYAAGDAAASGNPPLTPVAAYEGRIVASNLLKGNHRMVESVPVPSVLFTVPPLASVGLSEKSAQEKGIRFKISKQDTSNWYSSRRVAEDYSGFKILVDEEKDLILGAHLIGPHAEELINLFALSIQKGIPASELKHTIFGYPTLGSDIHYMI